MNEKDIDLMKNIARQTLESLEGALDRGEFVVVGLEVTRELLIEIERAHDLGLSVSAYVPSLIAEIKRLWAIVPACEHKWTGQRTTTSPSEPDEWVEFCELCGMERHED